MAAVKIYGGNWVRLRANSTPQQHITPGKFYMVYGLDCDGDLNIRADDGLAHNYYASKFELAPNGTEIDTATGYTPGHRQAIPEIPQVAPSTTQVGGSHYTDMAIQPIEYVMANGIPFAEGNVIKYVSRWRKKGGVQDLKKARHMLDVLIAFEEQKAAA
jgi:hypothetical protein